MIFHSRIEGQELEYEHKILKLINAKLVRSVFLYSVDPDQALDLSPHQSNPKVIHHEVKDPVQFYQKEEEAVVSVTEEQELNDQKKAKTNSFSGY